MPHSLCHRKLRPESLLGTLLWEQRALWEDGPLTTVDSEWETGSDGGGTVKLPRWLSQGLQDLALSCETFPDRAEPCFYAPLRDAFDSLLCSAF